MSESNDFMAGVDSPHGDSPSFDGYSDVPNTQFSCVDDTVVDETHFSEVDLTIACSSEVDECPKSPNLKAERHKRFMKELSHWCPWANGVDCNGVPFYSDTEAIQNMCALLGSESQADSITKAFGHKQFMAEFCYWCPKAKFLLDELEEPKDQVDGLTSPQLLQGSTPNIVDGLTADPKT